MIYKGREGITVVFKNKRRASYATNRYGTLLDKIVAQSIELDKKVWNYYEKENNMIKLFYYDQVNQSETFFIVDEEDLHKVSEYYWTLNCNGYAHTRTGGQTIFLHNLVLDFDSSKDTTDHINRIKTDNRKSNLRRVSYSLNGYNKSMQSNNTSAIVEVDESKGKWRARIQYKGISYSKNFNTKVEAIKQRKEWEEELAVKFNDYGESQ